MQFTVGSWIFLGIIAVVIVLLIMFKRWRGGEGFNINLKINFKPGFRKAKAVSLETVEAVVDKTVPCFNVYSDKMIIEDQKNVTALFTWEIHGKPYVFQSCIDGDSDKMIYAPIVLPDDITYQPDRLARMIGCLPLKRLKSLKFGWLERLQPFAPIAALGIAAVLLLIVMD